MPNRPLIGLNMSVAKSGSVNTGSCSIGLSYTDAIERAGGLPVLVPPYADAACLGEALERLDGFCFIGGPDYDPAFYGGRAQRAEELMDPRRDRFDLDLARRVLDGTPLPVLGICGGCQLISIARGGRLVQDLRTEWNRAGTLPHAKAERAASDGAGYRHDVRLADGSLIAHVTRAPLSLKIAANSFHHQAVRPDCVGADLRATAWAPDEVIEAIEPIPDSAFAKAGRFVLGVQWHPERMPDDERMRALFQAFVAAAMVESKT
ncbi:MAG: gamma-glutamyl-gamma-aminobutyrate hydrolase family protein [Planctomycetota bacterium]|nr:gamma-glutamyl-gamma-aminobutyrate hydrolase family protein [Planctomycetota bacterium]